MAEKISDKEQIKKEALEAPVADAAEKVIEKNPEATEKDLDRELDKELEGNESVDVVEAEESENADEEKTESSEEKKDEASERNNRGRGRYSREEQHLPWNAKTKLGKDVKEGKIKDIDEILGSGKKIMEEQIIDTLLNVKSDLIAIGQSKGKFGGGKRRAWRQTQKKTKEGNVPSFSALAVVGDENGHVGIGSGKAQETLPARDKASRKAKLNLIKINRACGGFECSCTEQHSIPFKVTGKSGSVEVTLIPAPQGTGLVAAKEIQKVLQLAGIKDIYSKTSGKKRTSFNLVKACMAALEKTNPKAAEVKK